ncbi:hypothetical protein EI94DRAFT_619639 [Lactarius quietus]|nr:hypothetical protein EI94DRAFT_619639 [Lactarius quietus]
MGTRMAQQRPRLPRIPPVSPQPPNGHKHSLWTAATKDEPPRSSFCTALCLAVGHSFAADYTRRFEKVFESLDVISKCGSEGPHHRTPHIRLPTLLKGLRRGPNRQLACSSSLNEPPPPTNSLELHRSRAFPGWTPLPTDGSRRTTLPTSGPWPRSPKPQQLAVIQFVSFDKGSGPLSS